MKFPEYGYVDCAIGGVNRRNNVRKIQDFPSVGDTPDCYATIYRFRSEYAEHVDKTGSVSGTGDFPCYCDFLHFDIDNEDLSEAHRQARILISELTSDTSWALDPLAIRCYFSGSKGFHVSVPQECIGWVPAVDLPQRIKRIAVEVTAGKVDIDTCIYDKNRLFRVRNSKHSKTGLFKIPLTSDEILDLPLPVILKMAEDPRPQPQWTPLADLVPSSLLSEAWSQTAGKAPQITITDKIPCPPGKKPCIWRILNGVPEGQRHAGMMRLADYWRKEGLPLDDTRSLIHSWNARNESALNDREIETGVTDAYGGVYDWGCNDAFLSSLCGDACKSKKGAAVAHLYNGRDMLESYRAYIESLKDTKFTLGVEELDATLRGVTAGEVLGIVARAGAFKTATLQNILATYARVSLSRCALMVSMEMPVHSLAERYMAMASQMTPSEVEGAFAAGDPPEFLTEDFLAWVDGVIVTDTSRLSPLEFSKLCQRAKDKAEGKPVGVIGVDYAGLLQGQGKNEYELLSWIAVEVKRIAKELGLPIVMLYQTSRAGGDGTQEVSMNMARGSGAIEEACDFVLGMWKDGSDLMCKVCKNRKGPAGQTYRLDMNQETFRLGPRASAHQKDERRTAVSRWGKEADPLAIP